MQATKNSQERQNEKGWSGDATKPLLAHIEDMRRMLIQMLVVTGLFVTVAFLFREQIAAVMESPLRGVNSFSHERLQVLGVAESMFISLKLAFYTGVVAALPALFYLLARFAFPGLTLREKRIVLVTFVSGFGLFLLGSVAAFYFAVPAALRFFYLDAHMMRWQPIWTVDGYYSFVAQLTAGFGLAFELPVVVIALVKLGVLTGTQMRGTRPYAVVAILFAGAIITPTPDIFTLILVSGPMILLYEVCIWIAVSMSNTRPRQAGD